MEPAGTSVPGGTAVANLRTLVSARISPLIESFAKLAEVACSGLPPGIPGSVTVSSTPANCPPGPSVNTA